MATNDDDDRGGWENLRAPNPPGLLLGDPTGLHAFIDDHGGWYVGVGKDDGDGYIIDGWNTASSIGEAMKQAEAVYEAEHARLADKAALRRDLEYLVALGTYATDDDELNIVESIMRRCGVDDPKAYAQANPPVRYR